MRKPIFVIIQHTSDLWEPVGYASSKAAADREVDRLKNRLDPEDPDDWNITFEVVMVADCVG